MTHITGKVIDFLGLEEEKQERWDIRFLEAARLKASWSKDPSTKCGAIIVRPDLTIAGTGFNGFPKNCLDDEELYANRELKYERVVHAELNAILHTYENMDGYTIYTWPPSFGPTCARCAAHVIQAGITRVVHVFDDTSDINSRWLESLEIGLQMYREADVEVNGMHKSFVLSNFNYIEPREIRVTLEK